MRRHRIYCPTPISLETPVTLPDGADHHVAQVLRLKAGDQVVLFDGGGGEFECRLQSVTKSSVVAIPESKAQSPSESGPEIAVWHGICRGQRMDYVIQKSTELGASTIQPVFTEFGIVKLDAKRARNRVEHWKKIAISAAEQSGRCQVPTISAPSPLAEMLERTDIPGTKIVFDPTGSNAIEAVLSNSGPVTICTGPEGGLSERELELADQAGFHRIILGPRLLRTETAPVVALTLVQYLIGDLMIANQRL